MLLTVHVKPNAQKTEIKRWFDEKTVKINISAPPKNGAANKKLITFLADMLDCRKSDIKIVRGKTGRMKQIGIPDHLKPKMRTLRARFSK